MRSDSDSFPKSENSMQEELDYLISSWEVDERTALSEIQELSDMDISYWRKAVPCDPVTYHKIHTRRKTYT